jgi:hypothetical protein
MCFCFQNIYTMQGHKLVYMDDALTNMYATLNEN